MPPLGPFEFLFFDGGGIEESAFDLVAPGGLIVKDDLTPGRPWPDPVRELLLDHPQLVGVEILTRPDMAAIVAAKRRIG